MSECQSGSERLAYFFLRLQQQRAGEMERPVRITRMPKGEFFASVIETLKRQTRLPQQIPVSRLSKKLAERVITDAAVEVPDCISCGACCMFGLIPIERREPEPLTEYVEMTADHTDVVVERALWRREPDGRCRHLSGELSHEVGCSVYEDRPRTCRAFEAGSDRCFGFRRMLGIDRQLTEAEVAAAMTKLDEQLQPLKISAVDIKLKSRTFSYDQNSADPETPVAEELELKIVAHMTNGEEGEIYTFDPAKESWYEHELEGLTLGEAAEKIEQARRVSGPKM